MRTYNYGTYGNDFKVDEDGNPVTKPTVKREKRGRPCKNESSEQSKFVVDDDLYEWAMKRHFLTAP